MWLCMIQNQNAELPYESILEEVEPETIEALRAKDSEKSTDILMKSPILSPTASIGSHEKTDKHAITPIDNGTMDVFNEQITKLGMDDIKEVSNTLLPLESTEALFEDIKLTPNMEGLSITSPPTTTILKKKLKMKTKVREGKAILDVKVFNQLENQKKKRARENILKIRNKKKASSNAVPKKAKPRTTEKEIILTVWKDFWTVLKSVYSVIDDILNDESMIEKTYLSYLKDQYIVLSKEMHENETLDPDEEYTMNSYDQWRTKQDKAIQNMKTKSEQLTAQIRNIHNTKLGKEIKKEIIELVQKKNTLETHMRIQKQEL